MDKFRGLKVADFEDLVLSRKKGAYVLAMDEEGDEIFQIPGNLTEAQIRSVYNLCNRWFRRGAVYGHKTVAREMRALLNPDED